MNNNNFNKYVYKLYNNTDNNAFLSYIKNEKESSVNYKHIKFNNIDGLINLEQLSPPIVENSFIKFDGNNVIWSTLDFYTLFGLLELTRINWPDDNTTTKFIRADGSPELIDINITINQLLENRINNPNDISKILHGNTEWKTIDTIYNSINIIPENYSNIFSSLNINNPSYTIDYNQSYNGIFNYKIQNNTFSILIENPIINNILQTNLFDIIFKTNNNEIFKITENQLNNTQSLINIILSTKIPTLYVDNINSNYNNNIQINNNLLFDSLLGIDTIQGSNTVLNIGYSNANTINIGMQGNQIINIGSIGDVVNIQGDLTYINSTELQVSDKRIYLNEGTFQLQTARGAGIIIKDGNLISDITTLQNYGYILVSSTGNFYNIKAPENSYYLSTPILTTNSNILIDQGDQTINGNLLLTNNKIIDNTVQPFNIQNILNIGTNNSTIINIGSNISKINFNNDINITGKYLINNNQISTSNVLEGSNLYFTILRARYSIDINNTVNGLNYDKDNGILSIQTANSNRHGVLSDTDWNYFNQKVNKSGDTMSDYLLFQSTFGIDSSNNNKILNIGTSHNNTIINIGNSSSTINFYSNLNINGSQISTSNVLEGSNLYYTIDRVRSVLSVGISNGLTYDSLYGKYSLNTSSSTNTGALTNTDWNTFNNKVNKDGDTMSGNLLFSNNKSIDTLLNSNTLNIASINSNTTLNIGNSTTIINLNNKINQYGNILFASNFGIDNISGSNTILNIGNTYSSEINIGNITSIIKFNNNINVIGNYFVNGIQISTNNVLEGLNLYYTVDRVRSVLSVGLSNGLSYNTINGIFTLITSSSTTTGALLSSDWIIFNNKVNKAGDNISGNLIFNNDIGIDSFDNTMSLNIGKINSKNIYIGNSSNNIYFGNNNIYIGSSLISTSNIIEGTRLYYTVERVRSNLSVDNSNGLSYNNLSGIFTLNSSSSTTNGALLSSDWNTFNNKVNKAGDNISGNLIFNNDIGIDSFNNTMSLNIGKINSKNIYIGNSNSTTTFYGTTNITGIIKIDNNIISTTNIPEGNNLYFTILRARDSIDIKLNPLSSTTYNNYNGLFYDKFTGYIGLGNSSSTTNGALLSSDWNTFNNKVNKAGDTMSGNLLFNTNLGIDSTGIIKIGNSATTVNIGNSSSIINPLNNILFNSSNGIDSTNGSLGVLNIGNLNAKNINIGYSNSNIYLYGNIYIGTSLLSTSVITQGSNLYYTDEKVRAALSVNISNGLSYNNTNGVFSLIASSSTNTGALLNTDWIIFNNKVNKAGDTMSGNLLFNTNIGIDTNANSQILNIGNIYNNTTINIGNSNSIINYGGSPISTSKVSEGTNLYFTNLRAQNAISCSNTNGLTYTSGLFTLITSSSTNTGSLTNTDWNTFNNKVNKAGDTMSGNLLFNTNLGIDSTGIIKIGNSATTVNIGNSSSIINPLNNILFNSSNGIDSTNGSLGVLNIGNLNAKNIIIGNFNIDTYTYIKNNLYVSGTLQTSGEVYSGSTISLSDKNLKTNIRKIENNIFDQLNPVQYEWKNNIDFISKNKQGKTDVGFIAQEIELIAPHLVSEFKDIKTDTMYKGIDYEKIIPYLVDEIKILKNKLNNYDKMFEKINKMLNINISE